MKKTVCLILAALLSLGMLIGCSKDEPKESAKDTTPAAPETTPEETEEVKPEETPITYEEEDAFADFDMSTIDTTLQIANFTNDWSGVVLGKTKKIAVEKGRGWQGSNALAVYSIGTGADNDLDMKYENDSTAVIDWTGAEQVWYYIDGSDFGSAEFYGNFGIQEQNADSDGVTDGTWQAWCVTEGTVVHIFDVNKNSGWEDVTCVTSPNTTWDPGRIPLPAGFKGWVAIDVETLSSYWSDGVDQSDPLNLVYMNQFNWSVEGSEASVGHVCYVDSYSIVGKDVKNGRDCPVQPMNNDAKWVEVWNFEAFVPTEPEETNALIDAANRLTFDKVVNDWAGVVPEMKSLKVVEGKGVSGSKALAVTANAYGSDADCDVYNTQDKTAVTDWSGAEQIWVWLDAENYGTTGFLAGMAFAEENINGDGALDGTSQAWAITEGVTAHLYDVNQNSGWEDVTCVSTALTDWDPGRIPVPAGFKGWVAVDVASMKPYWSNAEVPEVFDLKNVNQFNWSMETSESAIGQTLYVDSYAVVGKAVNGGDCPVQPTIDGAKFLEVWGFEGIEAE